MCRKTLATRRDRLRNRAERKVSLVGQCRQAPPCELLLGTRNTCVWRGPRTAHPIVSFDKTDQLTLGRFDSRKGGCDYNAFYRRNDRSVGKQIRRSGLLASNSERFRSAVRRQLRRTAKYGQPMRPAFAAAILLRDVRARSPFAPSRVRGKVRSARCARPPKRLQTAPTHALKPQIPPLLRRKVCP